MKVHFSFVCPMTSMNVQRCYWMLIKCKNRHWIWFTRKCLYFRANECIFALLVAVSRKWLRISRNEQQKVYNFFLYRVARKHAENKKSKNYPPFRHVFQMQTSDLNVNNTESDHANAIFRKFQDAIFSREHTYVKTLTKIIFDLLQWQEIATLSLPKKSCHRFFHLNKIFIIFPVHFCLGAHDIARNRSRVIFSRACVDIFRRWRLKSALSFFLKTGIQTPLFQVLCRFPLWIQVLTSFVNERARLTAIGFRILLEITFHPMALWVFSFFNSFLAARESILLNWKWRLWCEWRIASKFTCVLKSSSPSWRTCWPPISFAIFWEVISKYFR